MTSISLRRTPRGRCFNHSSNVNENRTSSPSPLARFLCSVRGNVVVVWLSTNAPQDSLTRRLTHPSRQGLRGTRSVDPEPRRRRKSPASEHTLAPGGKLRSSDGRPPRRVRAPAPPGAPGPVEARRERRAARRVLRADRRLRAAEPPAAETSRTPVAPPQVRTLFSLCNGPFAETLIAWSDDGVNLLATPFADQLDERLFANLKFCNSVPAFLASVQLNLFERQTLFPG